MENEENIKSYMESKSADNAIGKLTALCISLSDKVESVRLDMERLDEEVSKLDAYTENKISGLNDNIGINKRRIDYTKREVEERIKEINELKYDVEFIKTSYNDLSDTYTKTVEKCTIYVSISLALSAVSIGVAFVSLILSHL